METWAAVAAMRHNMHRDTRTIRNATSASLSVCVEPWGFAFELDPGSVAEFISDSAREGTLTVTEGEGFCVFGWPGSNLTVVVEGKVIYEAGARVPDVPGDMSVRGFLDMILGEAKGSG